MLPMTSVRSALRLAFVAAVLAVPLAAPAPAAAALSCSTTHWVGAWADSPSNAALGFDLSTLLNSSLDVPVPTNNETVRAMLTPTMGGTTVRIHLSNRWSDTPVTFGSVTIGHAGASASLQGPPTPVTFGGQYDVTLAPGTDIVSDPVTFTVAPMERIAVSVFVSNNAGNATEHFTALQTSYLSGENSGDHTGDTSGEAFSQQTTSRPYVDGLDVLAPASTGAVVTLGDSLTDSYETGPLGLSQDPAAVDSNGTYPDDLARRLLAANIHLSVLNEGISGNRVELPGSSGSNGANGPPAVSRIATDVLPQAGVTTVIWMEGLNDIAQSPNATAADLEAAYTQGIAQLHAAGLRVLQGTLTPTGSAVLTIAPTYGSASTAAVREQVNQWIRTSSPADGVIDFDAAVRDPSNPGDLNPAYASGDGVHLNNAGYQAMANAINLSALRLASCTPTKLSVAATPHRVVAAKRVALRFQVTGAQGTPVAGAAITVASHHLHTNARGRAAVTVRFVRAGRVSARVTATGYGPALATIQVSAPPRRRRRR